MTVKEAAIESIKKRDGRVVAFDVNKISDAISKAFEATTLGPRLDLSRGLAERVVTLLLDAGIYAPGVEEIQDVVERVLIEDGHVRAAKAYILYRAERNRAREMNTRLMKVYSDITFNNAKDNDIKRENANIDCDTAMGTMLKYGSEGAKQFYEMFLLKPEHAAAHRNGDIHIHDLDFYALTTTCCQIDIAKLFKNGFGTGHGTLREPTNINSYAALCCIAIQSNQNDQHGGQSIYNFDYGMALGVAKTYVRQYKDSVRMGLELLAGIENPEIKWPEGFNPRLNVDVEDAELEKELERLLGGTEKVRELLGFAARNAERLTERDTYKAMVAIIHNLNTMHSRAGAQTPFSTLNYGMDISPEGRMVIRNILLATEAGLGHGETPIFPIQIFRVKEGINYEPGTPNYDLFKLSCRVSAKRLFPNYSFQDAPFNITYYDPSRPETEISYMGCRTRVIGNAYDPAKEISPGRGNLSYTSINLPRLALKSGGNISVFYEMLDRAIDLTVDQLNERFVIQKRKHVFNFPFLMGQGVWMDSEKLDWEDGVEDVLCHGTMSIGFIGLAETLTALLGEHHGQSKRAQNTGLEIIGHMRSRLDELSEKTHMNYTLLATPAEGLSGRFVRLDREMFGEREGITDKAYYTNGFHIPVNFPITAYDKIKLEAPYHALTNAGHITYVEMDGDPSQNLEAFEQIVRAMHDAKVGYGSINHPVDRDPVCGFSGIIADQCPGCGRFEDDVPFERIRRITGYLVGTLDRFNDAKRAEERDRVKHN